MPQPTTTLELPGSLDYPELLCAPDFQFGADELPVNRSELTTEHLPALIVACRAEIALLEETLSSDDGSDLEHDDDPSATTFLKGCLQNARRMLVWAERQQQEAA